MKLRLVDLVKKDCHALINTDPDCPVVFFLLLREGKFTVTLK